MTNIRIIEKEGILPGKIALILAGVHGDERCGVIAFDMLIDKLKITKGKVIFIYANLAAIEKNIEFIEKNLNRCFFKEQPFEIINTFEGKTAREIIPYLDEADIMLDLHASGTKDSPLFTICDKQSFELAKCLPPELVTYNFDEFEPGSTDYYMNLSKKECACVECGYFKDLESLENAKKAIISFLRYSGNIEGELEKKSKKIYKIVDLYRNKNKFEMSRYFPDFEVLGERTLIGLDGNEEIYAEKGKIVLFVRNRDKPNSECFLLAEDKTTKESIIKQEDYLLS